MVARAHPRRGDVYVVALDPTIGSEIRKARPCVIVSPDEINAHMRTFIVAPLTSGGHAYPFRIPCTFRRRSGHIVLDQLRTIDHDRILSRSGRISEPTLAAVLATLQEMFAP